MLPKNAMSQYQKKVHHTKRCTYETIIKEIIVRYFTITFSDCEPVTLI